MSCRNIISAAQSILDGKLGIIEGARKLSAFRFDVKAEKDSDFMFLIGVDSETDHFPIGNAAKHWNSSGLKEKTIEIERFERAVKDEVLQACRNLIQKYQ